MEDKQLLFSVIMVLVGILQFALLAESGNRKFDANFCWGYMLSGLILWITTTIRFLQMYVEDQEKKGYELKITIGYIFLFSHFIAGIYYFYLLWNGAIL